MPQPTLIVVDMQRAFDEPGWGERNNPGAEQNVAEALSGWRASGAPVIHIRHESAEPEGRFHAGTPGFEFKPEAEPLESEPVLTKNHNSGFIGTDLEERLRAAGAETVAIVGMTTDHCVSTTVRMAANLGFETWLLADATATHERTAPDGERLPADLMHRAELAALNEEFADVMDTADALARVRRD